MLGARQNQNYGEYTRVAVGGRNSLLCYLASWYFGRCLSRIRSSCALDLCRAVQLELQVETCTCPQFGARGDPISVTQSESLHRSLHTDRVRSVSRHPSDSARGSELRPTIRITATLTAFFGDPELGDTFETGYATEIRVYTTREIYCTSAAEQSSCTSTRLYAVFSAKPAGGRNTIRTVNLQLYTTAPLHCRASTQPR